MLVGDAATSQSSEPSSELRATQAATAPLAWRRRPRPSHGRRHGPPTAAPTHVDSARRRRTPGRRRGPAGARSRRRRASSATRRPPRRPSPRRTSRRPGRIGRRCRPRRARGDNWPLNALARPRDAQQAPARREGGLEAVARVARALRRGGAGPGPRWRAQSLEARGVRHVRYVPTRSRCRGARARRAPRRRRRLLACPRGSPLG